MLNEIFLFLSQNFVFPRNVLTSTFLLFLITFFYFLYKNKKNIYILFLIPLVTSFYSGLSYAFRFTNVHETAALYWDVRGLWCANLALDAGLSPYNGMADCMFPNLPMLVAYQPIFLNFFWNIDYSSFKLIWLSLAIIFLIVIYISSKQILNYKSNLLFFVLFLLGAYEGSSWITFQSGNIAIITYGISFYFLYRLIQNDKSLGFFVTIGILTAFKYHFILLLLYPVLVQRRIDIKYHALTFLVFFATTLTSYYMYPHLYNELFTEVIGKQLDQGLKPYPSQLFIYDYFRDHVDGLKFNTFFKGFVFVSMFLFFYNRIRKNSTYSKADLFILATFMINLCLPRLKLYDLLLIIPCTIKILEESWVSTDKKIISRLITLIIACTFFFIYPQWWWDNWSYYYIIVLFLLYIYQKDFFKESPNHKVNNQ
tara:strand:+ start:557 stop:1834 length:1278 start_codon:yes stop_codon:yes gene_type:complete